MARELRRLLIPPQRLLAGDHLAQNPHHVCLEPHESHYLKRVLRLRPGDGFAIFDGVGRLWTAKLAISSRDAAAGAVALLDQPLEAPLVQQPEPAVTLELAIAMPKRDGELLLRMACELGLDRLSPLVAERSAVAELRQQRCLVILSEAAEQCERMWLPVLSPVQSAADFLEVAPTGVGLLTTTRRKGLPLVAEVLNNLSMERLGQAGPSDHTSETASSPIKIPGVPVVTVAVGPEGGWSDREEDLAESQGWIPVTLGPTILRSSTAAVAAATVLSHWRAGL